MDFAAERLNIEIEIRLKIIKLLQNVVRMFWRFLGISFWSRIYTLTRNIIRCIILVLSNIHPIPYKETHNIGLFVFLFKLLHLLDLIFFLRQLNDFITAYAHHSRYCLLWAFLIELPLKVLKTLLLGRGFHTLIRMFCSPQRFCWHSFPSPIDVGLLNPPLSGLSLLARTLSTD